MDKLSLEEINLLIIKAGGDIVVTESSFVHINASNEAQYAVTYGELTGHIFITQDPDKDNVFKAGINSLV